MDSRIVAIVVLQFVCAQSALGYRPFDSTDAAVAGPGEFELEFGPLGRLREGSRRWNVSPAVIANLGFADDRELVIQGQRQVALDREANEPRSAIVENGVFIKQVLRRGVLQEQSGPSIATEYGLLLPSVHGENGTGFSIAGLGSQRSEWMTLHLNAAAGVNRAHDPELFLGAILEGPYAWRARPVAEIFTDHASGSPVTHSRLVGVILRARDDLSFDIGIRQGSFGEESIRELRLGFTWSFSFKKEQ